MDTKPQLVQFFFPNPSVSLWTRLRTGVWERPGGLSPGFRFPGSGHPLLWSRLWLRGSLPGPVNPFIAHHMTSYRRGKNTQLPLAYLLRHSAYGRIAAYPIRMSTTPSGPDV